MKVLKRKRAIFSEQDVIIRSLLFEQSNVVGQRENANDWIANANKITFMRNRHYKPPSELSITYFKCNMRLNKLIINDIRSTFEANHTIHKECVSLNVCYKVLNLNPHNP